MLEKVGELIRLVVLFNNWCNWIEVGVMFFLVGDGDGEELFKIFDL